MIDKALSHRESEARRIARAEMFPIIDASEDWTAFSLDDGQEVYRVEGQFPNIRIVGTKTIRTHFRWVEESKRFEGFVS